MMLPPTLIIGMLQEPGFASYDLSQLRLIFYGSAPMAVQWIEKTLAAFPDVELVQGYGLTEASPILTTLGNDEHRKAIEGEGRQRLKSIGQPVMGLDLAIVDDRGREVGTGESGEIAVRGGNVTKGYLNLPETTAQAIDNGWFHTGDIGKTDEYGYVYLLDRKKDMIISGGENVYSQEVEDVLYQLPNVHEAAVIGVDDDKFGESVFAVIVCKP
ncbi:MAG: long-chain fatty acid--CoA ligase, partial [Gammaproteobacteria bacterium]|nr:long-chain fatty acid--CoA ligase [Gammaproteobacteria bacterium]